MGERGLVHPTPELPDDTLIENVRFATRIRNVLAAAAWRQSARPAKRPTKYCSASRISERPLSPIFVRLWPCRRRMGLGRRARSQPDRASPLLFRSDCGRMKKGK
jgi:hypothetical protein